MRSIRARRSGEGEMMGSVIARLKARELPDSLRGEIDPDHLVEVVVTDLGHPTVDRVAFLAKMHAYRERLRQYPELVEADPVGRIRALRDEWDD